MLKQNKLVCSECGGSPIVGKGKCRKCYDKKRLIIVLNIKKDLVPEVHEFANQKRWSMPYTINYLTKCGLKWVQKQEALKEEFDIK